MTSLELSKKQLDKPKEKGEVYLENEACKSKMSSSQREENCKDTVNSEQSNHTLAPLGGLASVLVEKSGQEDSLWSQGHI